MVVFVIGYKQKLSGAFKPIVLCTCTNNVNARRKHILFRHLYLRRTQNESPVLLCISPGLSRDTYSRISQVFFERFNVAGFSLLLRPMAQIYAAGVLNGIVVDIGYDRTDITPVHEGFIISEARTTTTLGIRDCQQYLAQMLKGNQSILAAFPDADDELLGEIAQKIWEEGLVKVPSDGQTAETQEDEGVTDIAAIVVAGREKQVIEGANKKKATSKASAAEQARAKEIEALDLVSLEFRGHTLTFGRERHRFCEPLFDPSLLREVGDEEKRPIQEAIGHAVGLTGVLMRQEIWAGLFVTGELTNHVKGNFRSCLMMSCH